MTKEELEAFRRVVAEVKTPTQSLRATLNLSGKVQDPVIRK